MVRLLILVLFCFISFEGNSQNDANKNQVSINASKFFVVFNEQINNLDLSHRYALDSLYNLRSALNIAVTTSDVGITDLAVRLGVDRYFKKSNRWRFYYGCELNFSTNSIKSSKRVNNDYGLFGFLGILYHFGDHFSISTEPTLAFFHYRFRDKDDFGPQANSSWNELKLLNIGQINFGFHF